MITFIHHPEANFSKISCGAKGAGLIDMAQLGLPVPPGFILSPQIELHEPQYPDSLHIDIRKALSHLEQLSHTSLGHPQNPLFISVRSGAALSMPGMMDTLLNVGLNDHTLEALTQRLCNPERALETYARFLESYGRLVLNISWPSRPCSLDFYKEKITQVEPRSSLEDVHFQLLQALKAIKNSWNNLRAQTYRAQQSLSHAGGTAIIIQLMVFGNGPDDSGTGVLFTRNPKTGAHHFFGEYLPAAQGEDLVSGSTTPQPLTYLASTLPSLYGNLTKASSQLEYYYKDMQDIEFTIEQNKLWFLQTRAGKRTPQAAFKIAFDRLQEDSSSSKEALTTIDPSSLAFLLHPQFLDDQGLKKIGQGLAASPGASIGPLCFDPHLVQSHHILVCPETCSEEMPAMMKAQGVITLTGGMTSHAAVIMRSLGKPCITAFKEARFQGNYLIVKNEMLNPGDMVTMDGTTGQLFRGEGHLCTPEPGPEFYFVMDQVDQVRKMEIWANADTPHDIQTALRWGAQGIGLCRSEHMMLASPHVEIMHDMILAPTEAQRKKALSALLPLHQKDFQALIKALNGKPLTVRLLDPPLHEFLPTSLEIQKNLATRLGMTLQDLTHRREELREVNPMLGHRGCRLGISFPDLYTMQVQALFQAAEHCRQKGFQSPLALMIPFIMDPLELIHLKNIIQASIPSSWTCPIGAMIEIPRAALLAHEIAPHVDFLSFGTNDLTQMTWGLSRDDSASFFKHYEALGLSDPFQVFDEAGVGFLVARACQQARAYNPSLTLSVCGEHAGYPKAISFFHHLGIEKISCSPWRLPAARLAAAQAVLNATKKS